MVAASRVSLRIDAAVAIAEMETGALRPPTHRTPQLRVAVHERLAPTYSKRWSEDEDQYLKEHLGRISVAVIAAHLGRTVTAVNLRWKRDLHLTCPRRNPEWMTAEQVAIGMGVNGKSIHMLMDRGLMPSRRLPGEMVTRVIDRQDLLLWLVNPLHWCYFDPRRIATFKSKRKRGNSKPDILFWRHARRLADLRRSRWNDEWLSIGQVGKLKRVNSRVINKAIHQGRIRATDWGNWWVLRSEAERFIPRRKGVPYADWTPAGDEFLLMARASGYLEWDDIGRMMKWNPKRCAYRLKFLLRSGKARRIIRERGLPIIILRHGKLISHKHYMQRKSR